MSNKNYKSYKIQFEIHVGTDISLAEIEEYMKYKLQIGSIRNSNKLCDLDILDLFPNQLEIKEY